MIRMLEDITHFDAQQVPLDDQSVMSLFKSTCGSEDFLIEKARETRDFFQGMEGNPYHYVYEEHEGIHGWDYWDEHITDFLNYLEKILKK